MMTPSDPALLAAQERRLHPWSWLFLALGQLRQFAVPLVVLLLVGRGDGAAWWESLGAIGAVFVAGWGVLQYVSYRFHIARGELTIRSGVLQRRVRHIPLAKIQNVALRRNLLHRAFGVAEVRLESAAGSAAAEAEMRVLSLADAEAMEALVRASRGEQAGDAEAPALLALPTAELVRLGIASNRGMVVVAAAIGVLYQVRPDGFGRQLATVGEAAIGAARAWAPGPVQWLLGALLLVLLAFVVLRLLSVALVILRLHGFRLVEQGARLSVEGGLLTRLRGHAARPKLQRYMVEQNLWLRLMQRASLRAETAAVQAAQNDGQGRERLPALVPIAPVATIDALIARWHPGLPWPDLPWRPLHPRAWRRFLLGPVLAMLGSALLLSPQLGAWAGLLALSLPLIVLRARRLAAWSAWHVGERHVVWRSGWLDRHWQIAEIARLQLVRLEQSPFDRRHGMASVLLDTAGADPQKPALRLRYLPEAEARAVAARLTAQIAAVT